MVERAEILGPSGPFAQQLGFFKPRQQQQEMAASIETLIRQASGVLVAESPTGTGKTLAYLVPAMNTNKKTIISTATKHLQDQIFFNDIPLVLKTLGIHKKACLLKGRSNYLCIHRLHTYAAVEADQQVQFKKDYKKIRNWGDETITGDISDVDGVAETSLIWPWVTSNADNCLGSECGHFSDCFVRRARLKALEADLIVVNHHLYLANLALKEDGLGQLLPEPELLIFDEAHGFPEVASMQLSRSLSSRQLTALVSDLYAQIKTMDGSADELLDLTGQLEKKLIKCLRQLRFTRKVDVAQLFRDVFVRLIFDELLESLDKLTNVLKSCTQVKELDLLHHRAKNAMNVLADCLYDQDTISESFAWAELSTTRFRFHLTPLKLDSLGAYFLNEKAPPTVFISATLSADGNFDFFCDQLGLHDIETRCWNSPFDYNQQCCLYLPAQLSEPRDPTHTSQLLEHAIKLIKVCKGRTFFLFTSHLALDTAYEYIKDKIEFPIFKQGQYPKQELIEKFRQAGNAVLLGTSSFWEGVDVKGSALSCVIIDKLPFASPDDPVLKARLKRMEMEQKNPFMHYQLPQAIIALKQGIGRLIRDETDYGIIMIGDVRLRSKSYGKKILCSLPSMPKTTQWDKVEQFAQKL